MNFSFDLSANRMMFFNFMKEKYPIFYNSNVFFRDIQYAIISYYQRKDIKIKPAESELIAEKFVNELEKSRELIKISTNSWKVNFFLENSVIEKKMVTTISE